MSESAFLQGDKNLTNDINKAGTFNDLRALLENAVERSPLGVTRDPQTGQFVRRDPLTPAAQQTAPVEDEVVTKTQTIGGKEFTFTGSELEIEKQIGIALQVANELKTAPPAPVAPRAKTSAERDLELFEKTELELKFRRGEISSAEYLGKSGAVGEYLAAKGFDLEEAANSQQAQSWAQATEAFYQTPEGATWKGGHQNVEIMGNLIASHDLVDAVDKVAALRSLALEMREKGLEFDPTPTEEQVNALADQAKSPQEILEAWKTAHSGDAEAANAAFISTFQNGRQSSGIFGR